MIAGAGGEAGDIVFAITVPDGGGTFNPDISQSGGYVAVTDWGDGTTDTGVRSHTYSAGGDYIVRYWRGTGGAFTSMSPVYGSGCSYITALKKWANPESITSGNNFFQTCYNLRSIPADFTLPNATSMYQFFGDGWGRWTNGPQLPAGFRAPNATSFANAFLFCYNLTSLPEGFSCPAGTSFKQMFWNCTSLIRLPSSFAIPNATDCTNMFKGCRNLVYTPTAEEYWENANITSYGGCFNGCTSMPNYSEIPDSWK